MLSAAKKHESLTGKLLLSSALVVVTVGYGWWQHGIASQQQAAAMAAMQAPVAPAPAAPVSAPAPVASTPAPQASAPAPDANSIAAATPAPDKPDSGKLAMAAPQSSAPQTAAAKTPAPAAAAPAAAPTQNVMLPADPVKPLTGMAAIQNFIPTEGVSPPLPPVSGTPDAGAMPAIPAGGTRLEDGDYTSDKIQFEWGDLRARIVVTGGKITTVQIVSYPDHRSQSLYLIQLADPVLTQEVIKSQQSKVNVVSSATNSSYAFQDAIANAIVKATR